MNNIYYIIHDIKIKYIISSVLYIINDKLNIIFYNICNI